MKATKLLPILAVVLCVPGIALRALHLLNGFDVSTGLPTAGDKWIWFVIALFVISAIVYAVLALPLKTRNKVPFEQLLGTKETLFRMAAVVAGLIIAAGSLGYLYLTITTAEQDVAAWARVLEIVYAIMGVLTGGCMISLAKAQGVQMTEKSAAMTLVPLFWSCLHLLVNYRMTCTDPRLQLFAFGLLFEGIAVMAEAMEPLAAGPVFRQWMAQVRHRPGLGLLAGLGMTLAVQSSSATIAVLQQVAARPGPDGGCLLGLAGAIPVLLGDNIGTTVTAVLASVGQSRDAKRLAAAHALFNLSGAAVCWLLLPQFTALVRLVSPHGPESAVLARQIANAHTLFNLGCTVLWLPLTPCMVRIVCILLPEKHAPLS
mgnify:CR=1 FL=1